MRGGFTIAKLAEALRGIPRELSDDNAALPSGASSQGARYGIILVAADVLDDKTT